MRTAVKIELSEEAKIELKKNVKSRKTPIRIVERSKIVLMASEGKSNKAISLQLNIDKDKVGRWRKRYAANGIEGIKKDLPRGGNYGGKNTEEQKKLRAKVIRMTTRPPDNGTHWSTRSLGAKLGVSESFVRRVWKDCGFKPHLIRTFKISNDPHFEEKLTDVVGLYVSPPENAVVFSVDEKSSIQALGRTQPGLPMKKGRCGTMTHDYKRHGTSTLFAALNVFTGRVLGKCMKRHRHSEFLKFLKELEKEVDKDLDLHIIVDNYATHKHEKVKKWVAKNPRAV